MESAQRFLKLPLLALALVPLIVTGGIFFPYISGKAILIRVAVTLFWILFAIVFWRSGKFKEEISSKLRALRKNPIFALVTAFVLLTLMSTALAANPYRAFFGDIERAEGLLGTLYLFGFFAGALLVFEKRDWLNFFRLSVLVGAILFFDTVFEFLKGTSRPNSFIGNPTFLAGYFIFVIFAALSVFLTDNKAYWKLTSAIVAPVALLGIFITGTRGAILGLIAGTFLVVVYLALKGGGMTVRGISVRKAMSLLLLVGVVAGGIFILTRNAALWQKVPGLDRLAQLSLNDPTFKTRLFSLKTGAKSVNPELNGWGRTLFGWGPENFDVAYNKYYNPEFFRYENLWFDRAHNKLMDVLVMNGVLGLAAYLGIWLSALYLIFRKISDKKYAIPLLFFAGAYFMQNLFVFDQVSTYIPFFAFLAFAVGSANGNAGVVREHTRPAGDMLSRLVFLFIASAFAYSFVFFVVIPYYQATSFVSAIKTSDGRILMEKMENYASPYTFAQAEIRHRLLGAVSGNVNNPQLTELVSRAIALEEEVVAREPYEPRDFVLLGNIYNEKARVSGNTDREKAEEYYKKALELAPRRQDTLYYLSANLAEQGRFDEAETYLDEMLSSAPDATRSKFYYGTVLSAWGSERFAEAMDVLESALASPEFNPSEEELIILRNAYNLYLNHFYRVRDEVNFLAAMERAKDLEERLEKIMQAKLEAGMIKEVGPKRSVEIERGIQGFKDRKWDAITIE